MTIKKFFDPGENAGGGNPIAALMAKAGIINETETPVAEPVQINPEVKEPSAAPEVQNVATTPAPSTVETANPQTPSQEEQVIAPKVDTPAPAAQQPVPLQEVLGQYKPEQVLKELGFDDNLVSFFKELKEVDPKMVAFLNTWKNNGDLNGYLKQLTTDYSKMSAEDVMREQLKQEYPDASPRQIDILFNREVVKAYSLDSSDPNELEEGKELLEAKAAKFRSSLVQNQQNYLLPKPPEPKQVEPDNTAELVKQEVETQRSQVLNSDFLKGIISSKNFVIGEGEDAFSFPVDNPNELVDVLYDTDKYLDAIFEKSQKDGKIVYSPKTEHQVLVGLVAKYGKSFLNEYAKHHKSLGGKIAVDPIENAKPPEGVVPAPVQVAPKTAAEAMARHGQNNSGGY